MVTTKREVLMTRSSYFEGALNAFHDAVVMFEEVGSSIFLNNVATKMLWASIGTAATLQRDDFSFLRSRHKACFSDSTILVKTKGANKCCLLKILK
jgi:hypothetical protein